MKKYFEWLYLNLYSIILFVTALALFCIPLYRITIFFIPPQILAGLFSLSSSMRLFGSFGEKKKNDAYSSAAELAGISPGIFRALHEGSLFTAYREDRPAQAREKRTLS